MSTNVTHSLHCSQEVYSMIRAIEQVTNNKNMGDFAGWTSSINRHTDLVGSNQCKPVLLTAMHWLETNTVHLLHI